ncbi:Uncharacterised protein [Bordetella pertussis]|nr:Uncharacterised protein [Bordetella pertussis]
MRGRSARAGAPRSARWSAVRLTLPSASQRAAAG